MIIVNKQRITQKVDGGCNVITGHFYFALTSLKYFLAILKNNDIRGYKGKRGLRPVT
jgi:hypothetical protein